MISVTRRRFRRSQPKAIDPLLMPSTALNLAADKLAIRRRPWCVRESVPHVVASSASGHNILSRVPTALALRDQVLRSTPKLFPSRAAAGRF